MALVASDSFKQTDGTTPLLGSLTDEGNLTWAAEFGRDADKWVEGFGYAYAPTAYAGSWIHLQTSDPDIDITAGVSDGWGILFRAVDTDYYWRTYCQLEQNGSRTVVVEAIFESDRERIATYQNFYEQIHTLRVVAVDDKITIFINGTAQPEITVPAGLTYMNTATKHGLVKGTSYGNAFGAGINHFSISNSLANAPVAVRPIPGEVLDTSRPTFVYTIQQGTSSYRLEYQFDKDPAFNTVDLRTLPPSGPYFASGTVSRALTSGERLPAEFGIDQADKSNSLWFVRARQISSVGEVGSWSSPLQFYVWHPPVAVNLSPSGGQPVPFGTPTPLSWDVRDTDPDDSIATYALIIYRTNPYEVVFFQSGLFTGPPYMYSVPNELKGVMLFWSVKLTDTDGLVQQDWSPYGSLVARDQAVITIIDPGTGIVDSPAVVVNWTSTVPGSPQQRYRVTVNVDNPASDLVYDSTWIYSAAETHSIIAPIFEDGLSYIITVEIYKEGIHSSEQVSVLAQISGSYIGAFTVSASNYDASGFVQLTWVRATDPSFYAWQVYRKLSNEDSTKWQMLVEFQDPQISEYKDWHAPAYTSVDYFIAQVVNDGNDFSIKPVTFIETVTTASGGYWFIDPVNEENNLRLHNVNSEQFKYEVEKAVFTVIGRGRHVDVGETIGQSGTLTAQLRGTSTMTAREQKQVLVNLYLAGVPVYLRNPFGDVTYISIQDIEISRIAGVGGSEFVDVTVPYLEVYE